MKKIISSLFVAVCLMMAVPVQAQFAWGLKGGVNLTKAKLSGLTDNFKAENTAGFFVGPMAEFTFPVLGIGVDGALLYSQKKAKIVEEITGMDDVLRQHSLEIPINLKYSIGLGKLASVFVAAGPSFGFNLKNDKLNFNNVDGIDDIYKKSEVSLNFGVGVKLIKHLQVGVNYNLPLTDSGKSNPADAILQGEKVFKFKNNTWQVSLAYLF